MRVLLVEDDPMIGEAIQEALKDASYAADWVKNGQTALTTLGLQQGSKCRIHPLCARCAMMRTRPWLACNRN